MSHPFPSLCLGPHSLIFTGDPRILTSAPNHLAATLDNVHPNDWVGGGGLHSQPTRRSSFQQSQAIISLLVAR